ncbi:MAG: hypothetical protein ACPIOQ_31585 [Promethearchaeia archaeon]
MPGAERWLSSSALNRTGSISRSPHVCSKDPHDTHLRSLLSEAAAKAALSATPVDTPLPFEQDLLPRLGLGVHELWPVRCALLGFVLGLALAVVQPPGASNNAIFNLMLSLGGMILGAGVGLVVRRRGRARLRALAHSHSYTHVRARPYAHVHACTRCTEFTDFSADLGGSGAYDQTGKAARSGRTTCTSAQRGNGLRRSGSRRSRG